MACKATEFCAWCTAECGRWMRWAGLVARRGTWQSACVVLVGRPEVKRPEVKRPEVKRPHGVPWCRWEDNIRMIITQLAGSTWTGSVCLRIREVAGFCESANEPSYFMKHGKFLDWLRRFSKWALLRGVGYIIDQF